MTDTEIIEGNKLINAFMGYPYNMTDSGYPNEVAFHKDWNILMPVVEKIHRDTDVWVTIMDNCCKIHWCTQGIHEPILIDEVPTIQAVYTAILQFITWHNNQNKTS